EREGRDAFEISYGAGNYFEIQYPAVWHGALLFPGFRASINEYIPYVTSVASRAAVENCFIAISTNQFFSRNLIEVRKG
ncbi:hypothetical protein C6A37_13655, partial [Desulfobacteraceae bacterium SEEP-SAG9]